MTKKANRESTVKRKLRYLKHLSGTLEDMTSQILNNTWKDKVKSNALDVLVDYAKFFNVPYARPNFRVYDNAEMYVPNPDMVKKFLYRVRSKSVRSRIMIALETGASAGEVWRLTWKDVNITSKTITITGNKGHRTKTYPISDELVGLLLQLTKNGDRIFHEVSRPRNFNDSIDDYKHRLATETGNPDFLKIHFHTFRHFAISWYYFKTKCIVSTQRFARHCNISNTLKYVHIVKSWIKTNEYEVVYAENKVELTKFLSEGYQLVTKTDWGFCLTKPKTIT